MYVVWLTIKANEFACAFSFTIHHYYIYPATHAAIARLSIERSAWR
ncbi:hypothetical protein C7S17_1763 [Burkholderia thailandensis]|nr:hypothetical protein [Burkholderia thailandensis]